MEKSINEKLDIPTFENFWTLYDKKVDKKKCEKKWAKLGKDAKIKLINHVPNYIASTPDKLYRKNPFTYLNGECWENEIIVVSGTKNSQVNTGNNSNASKYRGIGI